MFSQKDFRSLFDVAGKRLYFNHAAIAPLSRPVIAAMNEYFDHRRIGDPGSWSIAESNLEALRNNYAKLIGGSPDRIAMMPNTVTGINVFAAGYPWKAGDHILLYENEFPANVMPFLNLKKQGVDVEFLSAPDGRIDLDVFKQAVRHETRLITVSSVQYLTGYRADLKAIGEFCKDRNILFCVDAIQSVGALSMDVMEGHIDFLAAGGHKWLLSPLGSGFLYLTRELQDKLEIVYSGYMGKVNPNNYGDFDQALSEDARRFELGAFNAPSIMGALAATNLLLDVGPDRIFMHIRHLIRQFEQGLEQTKFKILYDFSEAESSGILMFTHENPEKNRACFEQISAKNVNISLRGKGLRFAPHYHNDANDVDAFLEILKKVQ